MGMLERMREPKTEGVAPGPRALDPAVVLSFLGAEVGVSSTIRRNCELFIAGARRVRR